MSRPTLTVRADLNGTGVLVDISARCSLSAGITHEWGRSDWTAAEPSAGTLTLTLDNQDGRFTPGNRSLYAVGCADQVLVEFIADLRVRRFRMGTPELRFPTGVAGNSVVSVQCVDVLAPMSARSMRSMLDESVLDAKPFGYWVMDESGSGLEPRPVDTSGAVQAPMVPAGWGDAYGWTEGGGPKANDGRSALHLWGDAVSYLDFGIDPLAYYTGLSVPLRAPDGGWPFTQSDPTYPAAGNRQYRYNVSGWVTVRNNFYSTANPGGDTNTGDHVALFTIAPPAGAAGPGSKPYLSLLWRARDGRFRIDYGGVMVPQTANVVTMSTESTHFVSWSVMLTLTAAGAGMRSSISVDGAAPLEIAGNYAPGYQPWFYLSDINRLTVGVPDSTSVKHDYISLPAKWVLVNPWAGTISRVAFYAGAVAWSGNNGLLNVADQGLVGLQSPDELPHQRVARIGAHLGIVGLAFAGQGSAQAELLPWQDTAGSSMLAAMSAAMAGEGGGIDCATIAGVETVRCWLDSTQRTIGPAWSIDVQADAEGVPDLSFDTSGVTHIVTAKSRAASVTWIDRDAPARWTGTEESVDSAYGNAGSLAGLAQYRSVMGRTSRLTPAAITIDAATAEQDLLASLLELRPGLRIRITGLPVAVVGYASVDCYVIGAAETHTIAQTQFTLRLQPVADVIDWYTDPLDGSIPEAHFRLGLEGTNFWLNGALTAGTTTVALRRSDVVPVFWTLDPADYPMVLKVDNEHIRLTSPPAVAGSIRTFTGCVRAVNGTTAATHAASAALPVSLVDGDLATCAF